MLPIQRIVRVLGWCRDKDDLTCVFMAMTDAAQCVDALHDVMLLFGGIDIDLDSLRRLQVRIFNLHGGKAFRVQGLRHG